jgi:hypothetical protein
MSSSLKSPLFIEQTCPVPLDDTGCRIAQTCPVPLEDTGCRINIAGYSRSNYKTFNPEGYTIICETGKYCDGLNFFPNTNTIVLECNSQSYLLFRDFPNRFIPDLAEKLDVSPQSAFEKSVDFFGGKRVVVQPTGLQGKVYNMMRTIQNCSPVLYTFEAVSVAKTIGLTGIQVITAAPLTFVGATYLGGLVCAYFGTVAGNNTLGTVFNASSYVLTRPMWGLEITLNGLILQPVSNVTGFPLILNGTNEILNGKGIKIQDYAKISIAFERVSNVTSKNAKRLKKVYDALKKAMTDFD